MGPPARCVGGLFVCPFDRRDGSSHGGVGPPWQRGGNENTNGLLRDYFPKGATLSGHAPAHLLAVEEELNHRPRMVLQDRCPADLFASLLASNGSSVLRR